MRAHLPGAACLEFAGGRLDERGGLTTGHWGDYRLSSAYQPIYSLSHQRPVGYEALLRGELGGEPVAPPLIFGGCVDTQEVVHLDRLSRALHVANFPWQATADSWLFLNVSAAVVSHGLSYVPFFAELLHTYQVPPERVVIEILEGAITEDRQLDEAVGYYRDLGCLVAIDDFGTGYSNFARIFRLNPHIVKLDRSLVSAAARDPRMRRTLPGLVDLLHEAGSLVLMEGVETEEEALLALDADADFAQGYFFGRPAAELPLDARFPDIWKEFRTHSQVSASHYREALGNATVAFQASASRLGEGLCLEEACGPFLAQPAVERCYLLDGDGRQHGRNVISTTGVPPDPRFRPVLNGEGAAWFRRPYFRRALERPGEVQVTRPYLSAADARLCLTLSVAFGEGDAMQVLCCDLNWEGENRP